MTLQTWNGHWVLEVRVLDTGSNPFAPQKEAGTCESPPDCLHAGDVVYDECGSAFPTHFKVGIFSLTPYSRVTQLVSGSYPWELLPVSPREDVSSGASCFIILEQNPVILFTQFLIFSSNLSPHSNPHFCRWILTALCA